jgi:hypothetical protein
MPFIKSELYSSQKEDFIATSSELEAVPRLNYKITRKTTEIKPKSN